MRALELRALDAWNRLRLAALRRRHPGLEIHPSAGSNLAVARWNVAPDARVRIAAGVVTERLPGRLHFFAESGATIEVGAGTWLRTELGEIHLCAFRGATLRIGPECLLNGCHLSAKVSVSLARKAIVGPGTRVFDADQHDLDDARPERREPVSIGTCVWISSDCTVLRGVSIGDHAIVGTRSLVNRDVPPHSLAFGQPAEVRGTVGDRSDTR